MFTIVLRNRFKIGALHSAEVLLFPSMAAECRGHPGADPSLISLRLMLIIPQRLDLSLMYSLACGEAKPNSSEAKINSM